MIGSLLGAAGLDASLRIATALARGVFDLHTAGRRMAEQRLSLAFGDRLPDAQRDAIVHTMYEHVARFWIEMLFLPRRLRPGSWRRCVHVTSATPLETLAERHPRCVLATCYFGNPAVAAFALGQVWRPVHVLVDLLAQPVARSWQQQLARQPNLRAVAVDDAARELPSRLRARGGVLLIVEHRRPRGAGVQANFLGESGVFQPTPGRLAAWFEIPVIPVLCRRRAAAFEFELWIGRPASGDDPAAVTGDVLAQLDAEVRRWPEQYLWSVPADPPRAGHH